MINRRKFFTTFAAALLAASPAFADGGRNVKDIIISQLRAQGYEKIRVGRTFLGRTRIIAVSPEIRREIILNPRTGEILRDYWQVIGPATGTHAQILSNGGSGSSSGNGSGSGSGSGNGGGGDGSDDGGNGDSGGGDDGSGGDDGGDSGDDGGDSGGNDDGGGNDGGGDDGGDGGGDSGGNDD